AGRRLSFSPSPLRGGGCEEGFSNDSRTSDSGNEPGPTHVPLALLRWRGSKEREPGPEREGPALALESLLIPVARVAYRVAHRRITHRHGRRIAAGVAVLGHGGIADRLNRRPVHHGAGLSAAAGGQGHRRRRLEGLRAGRRQLAVRRRTRRTTLRRK